MKFRQIYYIIKFAAYPTPMSSQQIDDIKNRLDIVEIIGSYIKLQKSGANYRAPCPFHAEKTPSFFVSPARQIWHCFGCGAGHSVFDFVMKIEGVEFGDALKLLAKRAGVELKPISKESAGLRTERERLYEICELAAKFFEKHLEGSSAGREAKKYLLSRGIQEESLKKWRLGYSPESWQGLSEFLISRGYKIEEIEKAGLSIKSDRGSFYDRFRGRIIFPIFDLNSQPVGFSARVFKSDDPAKYINTPNTILYDKSKILYGLDKAKLEIRKKDFCILVEGNIDVIMVHQAFGSSGSVYQNAVATCGTALTPYQLKTLKRYSNNLFAAFDMDTAGEAATKRGIDLAQAQGFGIKVVRLSRGKDPADLILENKEGWEDALAKAESIMDFYFETAFKGADPKTADGKKIISRLLLPVLKTIPDKIEQSHWIQELSKRLRVREEEIREELKKTKREDVYIQSANEGEKTPPPQKKSRRYLLEERLLTLILKTPQNLELVSENSLALFSAPTKEIFIKLKNKQIIESPIFSEISLRADIEETEKEKIMPEIKFCLQEIRLLETKSKLDKISLEIKSAEDEGDVKRAEELMRQFNQIINEGAMRTAFPSSPSLRSVKDEKKES